MTRTIAGLLAITLAAQALMAANGDPSSWENVRQLTAGQTIEVDRTIGEALKGVFVSLADQSITLRVRKRDIVVPRAEVSRIRLRSSARTRNIWLGAAIGGAGGAALGAGVGERIANESGGDFNNLKPAITAGAAALFALVGALEGSAISRQTTIFTAH